MNPLMVMALTFAAGTLVVLGVYSVLSDLFLRDRSRFSRRVDEEFRQRLRAQARKSPLFKKLSDAEHAALLNEGGRASPRERLASLVEQSGVNLTVGRLLGLSAGTATALGLVGFLLPGRFLAAGVGALMGGAVPFLYVALKRKFRLDKLLSQLPDTFDLMARMIRAGQTIPQALQAVADEFDQPIAGEFSYCYEQQNLGLPPEIALRDLARRTGLLEIKIFVLAMLVQQQTGGNLAELLEKLAAVVRERFKIRDKIKTLTAEGRLQAAVLLGLPPFLLMLILFLNRSYGETLLEYPSLLIGMFVAELLGALWIRKIINFDF